MRARHRPFACGVVGLGLLAVIGCGGKSAAPDAAGSPLLPTPSCGGTTDVSGTTATGYFTGDEITVDAMLGSSTSVAVYVVDSASGQLLSWKTSWPASDGGVGDLTPNEETNDATFISTSGTSALETVVSGTVDVLSATNPAAVSAAGHGGQVKETVAFSTNGFQLSGAVTSPYCQIFSSVTSSP